MQPIAITLTLAAVSGTVVPAYAQSHASIEARNEAAAYVRAVKFTVGRAARECRDLLQRDDAWMQAIVDDWLARNGRYSGAAEAWTTAVLTAVLHESGEEQSRALEERIVGGIRDAAQANVDALLGSDIPTRQAGCERYPALVAAGRLDIGPDMPQFPAIRALADAVDDAGR